MAKKKARQPIVAIVGKPNVGKSTLFNRIIGKRLAITSEVAGTTRDRLTAQIHWGGITFTLVDTAGLEAAAGEEELICNIMRQAELAIEEADLIVFLIDGQAELTKEDYQVAEKLRSMKTPVILAVNKAESPTVQDRVSEFYRLGIGESILISAIHGVRVAELMDTISQDLKKQGFQPVSPTTSTHTPRIALAGRPNVGKSTLFNYILGMERATVSDIPGTTRDTIDTKVIVNNQAMIFVDTAGVRKRGRIQPGIEKFSVLRTLKAVSNSDLAVVLLDAAEGPVRGDVHVITYALEVGKPVIVAINKTDLVPAEDFHLGRFPFLGRLPVVYISAKTGYSVKKLLKMITEHVHWQEAENL